MMNISAVSPMAKRSDDFTQLQSTLQSGNVSGAQAAFAAFLQDVQKTNQLSGSSSIFAPGTQASKDLQNLGAALKSANLSSARQAFASLEKDIQITGLPQNGPGVVNVAHSMTRAAVAANGVPSLSSIAQSAGSVLNIKA